MRKILWTQHFLFLIQHKNINLIHWLDTSKWPEDTRQTPPLLFIPQLHLTVLTDVQASEEDCVKVVQKSPNFPNSLLIKKQLAEQGIPARLRKTVQAHGTGTQSRNQEGLFLQCCRKCTHTSQRQWDKNSFLDLCLVANKELHSWPDHKTWQEMSGVLPIHSLYFGMST